MAPLILRRFAIFDCCIILRSQPQRPIVTTDDTGSLGGRGQGSSPLVQSLLTRENEKWEPVLSQRWEQWTRQRSRTQMIIKTKHRLNKTMFTINAKKLPNIITFTHDEASTSPLCPEDRLFQELSEFCRSKNATPIMPKYQEFCLGQGDPLMKAAAEHSQQVETMPEYPEFYLGQGDPLLKAAVEHTKVLKAAPLSPKQTEHEVEHLQVKTQLIPDYEEFCLGQGDPLLQAAVKHSQIKTHLIPEYQEFRMGQGNPLLKASVDHSKVLAAAAPSSSPKQMEHGDAEPDECHSQPHLIEHGSTLGGLGMADVVHLDHGQVVCFPVLPLSGAGDKASLDKESDPVSHTSFASSLLRHSSQLRAVSTSSQKMHAAQLAGAWNMTPDEQEAATSSSTSSSPVPRRVRRYSMPHLIPHPIEDGSPLAELGMSGLTWFIWARQPSE